MQYQMARRSLLLAGAGAIVAGSLAMPATLVAGGAPGRIDWSGTPLRLMMVAARGCPDCAAWHRQVGPGYAATATGRAAPLLEVDIDGPWPDGIVLGRRPRLTPSFVLLRKGLELGRFEGYRDAGEFGMRFAGLLDAAGKRGGAVRERG